MQRARWKLDSKQQKQQRRIYNIQPMAPTARLSGLQRDVLALYRCILREAIRKDRTKLVSSSSAELESTHFAMNQLLTLSTSSTSYARDKFREESSMVRRSDFKTIEYKIRKGKKQLELLKMPGVSLVSGA